MFLVILAFWLLLPFSGSIAEESQYCSAQPPKEPFDSVFQMFRGHEYQVNVIRHAKRFYYADLNFELVHFKLVAEYLKRMVFPLNVPINEADAYLIILNVNITTECKYLENGSKCIFWNETAQRTGEWCMNLPECSSSSTNNCGDLMMDEIGFCRKDVSNLIQKVAANGTFKIKEAFTDELKNTSNKAYKDLEKSLIIPLANSFSKLNGFQCIKILNISNGSITVDFQLTINGELNSEDFLRQSKDAISLIDRDVDTSSLRLKIEGLLKMNVSPSVIQYEKDMTVQCTIKDMADESKWFIRAAKDKERAPIAERRYELTKEDEYSISTLQVYATLIWEGKYTCSLSFQNGSIVHEAHEDVNIHLLPEEIIINPSNYTTTSQTPFSISVSCCIREDNEEYNVKLKPDDGTHGIVSSPTVTRTENKTCRHFEVHHKGDKDATYSCIFENAINQSTSEKFRILILTGSKKVCKGDNTWGTAQANSYMESNNSCENGTVGKIIRFCDENGQWGNKFENCTLKELLNLLHMATEIKEGRGNVTKVLAKVLDDLNYTLDPNNITCPNSRASVSILHTLSLAVNNSNSSVYYMDLTKFLNISSNIIQQKAKKQEGDTYSSILLKSIETFVTALQSSSPNVSQEFQQIKLRTEEFNASSKDHYFQNFSESDAATINVTGWSTKLNNITLKLSSILFEEMDSILTPTSDVREKFEGNLKVRSHILSTTLMATNNQSRLKTVNVSFTFSSKSAKADLDTAKCVFWNYSFSNNQGGWSGKGCESERIGDKIRCTCNHLTSFAVLMAAVERQIPFIEELTHIGLSISILSLFIWISIEKIMWKTITKSHIAYSRHITQLNTAIALLLAHISFVIGTIHPIKKNESLCTLATIFTHFFFLSMFFWTLNQSLTLLHQIIFVFHHIRKLTFLSFCFIIGYGCPLAIVIAATSTFLKTKNYKKKDGCWLHGTLTSGATASFTFIIPVGCIIGINIIILTVVILKLLRPNISEGLKEQDKRTIKKIVKAVLILTPSFGLTWITGFTLTEDSPDFMHYAFVLLNTFQGLFILITAGFTEEKIREAFFKRFRPMVSQSTSESVQTKQSFHSTTK